MVESEEIRGNQTCPCAAEITTKRFRKKDTKFVEQKITRSYCGFAKQHCIPNILALLGKAWSFTPRRWLGARRGSWVAGPRP